MGAQKAAKKVGIKFNFQNVLNNLENQYGDTVVAAVENLATNAEQKANENVAVAKQNPEFKNAQRFANQATFNKVVGTMQRGLKQQLKKIPNNEAQKNLIKLLDQGAAEAKKQLNKYDLGTKNVIKTVNNQYNGRLPEAKQQVEALKNKQKKGPLFKKKKKKKKKKS